MSVAASALALLALTCMACNSREPPPPEKSKAKPDPSRWKEVQTPVRVGVTIPCPTLLPPDKLSAAIGQKIELGDASLRDRDATAVCRVLVPAKQKTDPPEEMCQVSVYCWHEYTFPETKKACEARGETTSQEEGGDLTCLHETPAGDAFRYQITVLDSDTRCKLVVDAGPNILDLPTVQKCAKAAADTITRESLQAK